MYIGHSKSRNIWNLDFLKIRFQVVRFRVRPQLWSHSFEINLKSGHFCLDFKCFFFTKWQPFVWISNGWAFLHKFHWKILTLAGIWTRELPGTKPICYQLSCRGLDMVGLSDFWSHSKSGSFVNQPLFDHSKSRLVHISNPQCNRRLAPVIRLLPFRDRLIGSALLFPIKSIKNNVI